jgi:hypothetical protein
MLIKWPTFCDRQQLKPVFWTYHAQQEAFDDWMIGTVYFIYPHLKFGPW